MSTFTTEADLRFVGRYKFMLLAPFEYHVGEYPSDEVICVPKWRRKVMYWVVKCFGKGSYR
jgi:hypothetical protein